MGMEIGDLRQQLTKDLRDELEGVVNNYAKRFDGYYILVRSYWDVVQPNVLHTKLMILLKKPPAFIGTLLFLVDNKKGTITQMYALPNDMPLDGVAMSDQGSQRVFESAERNNSPLLN